MANPTKYEPSYSFTGWQASNPSRPLPAQRVDVEFQNLALTTDEIIVALAEIRRSDGKLSGGIVDLASLSDEVRKQLGGGGAGGAVAISDVTGLQSALNGKAATVHTHGISDVTGLQTALDGKSQTGHTHAISAINGLQAALDAKVSTASRGQPGGTATLASDGLLDPTQVRGGGGADAKAPIYFTKTDTLTDSKLFSRANQAADVRAQKLVETASPFNNNYGGGNISAFHVRHVAEGTERNGPRGAALGASISMFKEGFGTGTAKGGEIDGLYIVLRQDSERTGAVDTGAADGCGVLIDAAVYENVGFVGGIEGATTVLSNTQQNANGGGAPVRRLSYQIGCTNTAANGASMAYYAGAMQGQHDAGLLLYNNEGEGGYFREFINLVTNAGKVFGIDRRGTVSFGRYRTDGTTLSDIMHMQINPADNSLGWVNASKSVQLMSLNQNGDLSLNGGLAAANINTGGNVSANGTIQGGTVQANGNIIAGGKMQAAYIDLVPGGDPANGASGQPGRLWVGPSGALRYYDSTGQARRVVMTD